MQILFTKDLTIAINGYKVTTFAAGTLMDDPSEQILRQKEFFEFVDPKEAAEKARLFRIQQIVAEAAGLNERLKALEQEYDTLRGMNEEQIEAKIAEEKEEAELAARRVEDALYEDILEDEGTKDERIVRRLKVKA